MKKILIASPVHEKEHIFVEYLKSLRELIIPEGYEVQKLFVLHNCEHLKEHIKNEENETFRILNNNVQYDKEDRTHIWKQDNFNSVIYMKNHILKEAKLYGFDYIFFIDSDLILHQKTLEALISADKDMISNIFWTKWDKSNVNQAYLPNSWISNDYVLTNEFVNKLKERGTHKVGMTGACTLIKRKVFDNEFVNWNTIYNIDFSIWEDRAFCIKVACAGFEIYTDTNYPAMHLYREEDYEEYTRRGEAIE